MRIACRPSRPFLLLMLVLPYLAAGAPAAQPERCFRLLDATAYASKPDLRPRGLQPVQLFEPDRYWPAGNTNEDLPSPLAAQHWILDIKDKRGMLILDLERWWPGGADTAAADAAIRRYITVVDWLRGAGFVGKIGYYGVIPIWDRASALQPAASPARVAWHQENQRAQRLADRMDILYPSLYTEDEDIQSWEKFAVAMLSEARQLARGKPVYPFLSPQFAPGDKALQGSHLSRDHWARELEVVGDHADGAVIWGGIARTKSEGVPKWSESAGWWQATEDFLARRGACTEQIPGPPANVTATSHTP
jgi:hypothetical protein